MDEDSIMQQLVREGPRTFDMPYNACPSCTARTQKSAEDGEPGCQHMTCRCNHQYCFYCLAPHAVTRTHDLSFHKRECLLWEPAGGEDRYMVGYYLLLYYSILTTYYLLLTTYYSLLTTYY